jgi:mannosyltransferase OCH1-like enzyme
MRWRGFSFGLIILIILYLIIRSVFTLLALLFEGEFSDGIPAREIRPANSTSTGPSLIPKIIHQSYKDNDIPTGWREAQQSCIDLHPDYKYIVRSAAYAPRRNYFTDDVILNLIVMDR